MAFNCFGRYFSIVTFGEPHGPAQGVVIDGVPPRLRLDLEAVEEQLRRRQLRLAGEPPPPLAERVTVLSGLLEGQTTGAPLTLLVTPVDPRPEAEKGLREVFRPGHGDLTWFMKYGIRDWRGGGRTAGRETIGRVAAGAVARQVLAPLGVTVSGHVLEIGGVRALEYDPVQVEDNELRCGDPHQLERMREVVEAARRDGDSVGGVVELRAAGVPVGWGDPVFGKLDALLAGGLMSIGAVKAIEVGDGFALTRMRGSEANDPINPEGFDSNHAGGILGGISNGDEIVLRLGIKPTPGIGRPQCTVDATGNATVVSIGGQHDPCIVPRLVPVAEAMVALVLADAFQSQRAIDG